MKQRIILAIILMAFCAAPAWAWNSSPGLLTSSVIPGSGFSAGANPAAITPYGATTATEGILYVTKNGTNSTTCGTSPIGAGACLTIGQALTNAAAYTSVAIAIGSGTYAENLTISTNNVTLYPLMSSNSYENTPVFIAPTSGVPITVSGAAYFKAFGLLFQVASDAVNAAIINGTTISGGGAQFVNCVFDQANQTADVVVVKPNATDTVFEYGPSFIDCAMGDGTHAIDIKNAAGPTAIGGILMLRPEFYINSSSDVFATAVSGSLITVNDIIRDPIFVDLNKTTYIDWSADTNNSYLISNPRFANGTFLSTTSLKTFAGAVQGTSSLGEVLGLDAGIQQKSFTSSAIVTGGVTAFTAAGTLRCTDVLLETNSTGLAAGTNFVLSTNNVNGLATLASETVANLGASKTIAMSAASVTALKPFILESTKTLTIACSVANCTGAGTIKVTPVCVRLSQFATAS